MLQHRELPLGMASEVPARERDYPSFLIPEDQAP
jgi:hypothetical protein